MPPSNNAFCNENVFNTARDVSCHTASGKTADPAKSGWVRSLACAFPLSDEQCQHNLFLLPTNPAKRKGRNELVTPQ